MTVALVGSLVVLALLDSTSVGTFFVPLVLLLVPGRPRVAPILGYLATIAVFYLALGVLVMLGGGALFDASATPCPAPPRTGCSWCSASGCSC